MTDLWPAGEAPPLDVGHRGNAAIRQADSVAGLTGAVEAAGDGIPDVAVRAARAALTWQRDNGDALADPDNATHLYRLALLVTDELRELLRSLGWRHPDGTVPPTLAELGVAPGWTAETWATHAAWPLPDGDTFELPVSGVWVAWFDAQRDRPAEWLDWLARVEAAETDGRRRGVAWLSAALADTLDAVAAGKGDEWTAAEAQREAADRAQETHPWAGRNPIPGWQRPAREGASKALRALAVVLWDARLHAEIERERERDERRPVPGLVLPFRRPLASLARIPRTVRVEAGRVIDRHGAPLPLGPAADADAAEAARNLPALASLDAQRFLRWAPRIVFEAWRRYDLDGVALRTDDEVLCAYPDGDGIRVDVTGGWEALASLVTGSASKKAPQRVRQMLVAMSRAVLHLDDGPAGFDRIPLLHGLHYQRGTRKGPGRVTIRLPSWWGGGSTVHRFDGRAARILPILDIPALPRGLETAHAGLASIDLAAMGDLTEHAGELVTRGGVEIDWHRHARDTGVRVEHLDAALDLWQRGDDDNAARWVRVDDTRWSLADNADTAPALVSLRDLGGRSVAGRKGGRTSADKRRKARERNR